MPDQTLTLASLDTAQHYAGIHQHLTGIGSRMAALQRHFTSTAPRTTADEAWIAMIGGLAEALLAQSQALLTVVYVPPEPTPEGDPA
jgi:hypothetical protein